MENHINIYFVFGEVEQYPFKIPALIFERDKNSWNDFGHKIKYRLYEFSESEKYKEIGGVLVGFLEDEENSKKNEYISNNYIGVKREIDLPRFFSLLGGIERYRELVEKLGLDSSKKLLDSINDLVLIKGKKDKKELYKNAIETDVFKLAFMRDSENYYSLINSELILKEREFETIDSVSQKLKLNFKLEAFSNEHELDFQFNVKSILPKRISVMIGANGLGKSQALNRMVRSLISDIEGFEDVKNGRPRLNRLLAIATPGETLSTFPAESDESRIIYKRLIISRRSSITDYRGFGELCIQLVRSNERILGKTRWGIFKNAIGKLKELDNIVLPIKARIGVHHPLVKHVAKKAYILLTDLDRGGEQANLEVWNGIDPDIEPAIYIAGSIHPLSSGQISFLKFAIQATLFIENGTLVLLDEPETHLHPAYISEFITLLDSLLAQTGSISIIATHSVYLVREVPRSQVLVFKRSGDSGIDIVNPRLNTFGADIGAISFFVFENEFFGTLVDRLLEGIKESPERFEDIMSEISDDLSQEAKMYLLMKLEKLDRQ
jgi:predicted ATPase